MPTKEAMDVARAFINGLNLRRKRTATYTYDGVGYFTYQSSDIAKIAKSQGGMVYVRLAGWTTSTTRDRVNAVLEVCGADWRVCQRKGEQFMYYFRECVYEPMDILNWVPVAGPLGMLALRLTQGKAPTVVE